MMDVYYTFVEMAIFMWLEFIAHPVIDQFYVHNNEKAGVGAL
jgi:hypothetical protein